jgi:Photosynthetic reaction centre cytochrome C subunit
VVPTIRLYPTSLEVIMARRELLLCGAILLVSSCARHVPPASSTPPLAAPAPTVARGAPTGTPPGTRQPAPGAGRRVRLSRDSLTHLRANYVAQIMQQIAGRENEPAGQVFKNVQVLKELTAGQLVHTMEEQYGRALSWNCTNCHRAVAGDWATDTLRDKVRARAMQVMTNSINRDHLAKLYPKNTPAVTCATCHRGFNEPPDSTFLLPPRAPGPPAGAGAESAPVRR